MSFHSRGLLTPGKPKKRKEPSAPMFDSKPSSPKDGVSLSEPISLSSNRLLAGYIAYEFLSKGTIFGREWDLNPIPPVSLLSSSAESKRTKVEAESLADNYSEVASILKTDGAHISGIVNPTQLAQWIQK